MLKFGFIKIYSRDFLFSKLVLNLPLLLDTIQNKKRNSDRKQATHKIFMLPFHCLDLFLGTSSPFCKVWRAPNLTFRWNHVNSSHLKLWAEVDVCKFWDKMVKKWVSLLYLFYLYLLAECGGLWSSAKWSNKIEETWSPKSPNGGNTPINENSHNGLFMSKKQILLLLDIEFWGLFIRTARITLNNTSEAIKISHTNYTGRKSKREKTDKL